MVLAILIGAVCGFLGFLPLTFCLRAVKHVTETSNFSYASILLLATLASLVVLAGGVIGCILIARSFAFPFVLAEAIVLSLSAIVFGLIKKLKK